MTCAVSHYVEDNVNAVKVCGLAFLAAGSAINIQAGLG